MKQENENILYYLFYEYYENKEVIYYLNTLLEECHIINVQDAQGINEKYMVNLFK